MLARRLLTCCLLILSSFAATIVDAQDQPDDLRGAATLSTRFIPDDAVASVFVFPEEVLEAAKKNLLPTEVARAWSIENLGIDLADVHSVVLVVRTPGPAGVDFGFGVTSNEDFDIRRLNRRMIAGPAIMLSGYESYPLADTPDLFVHQIDPRTAVVATRGQLADMVAADEGTGPLPKLLATVPQSSPVMAAAVVEPVRRQLNEVVNQVGDQLPPPLAGAARIPELLDAIVVAAGALPEDKLRLLMLSRDEASAAELEEVINDALQFGRDMAVADTFPQIQDDDPVTDASREYAERLAGEIVRILTPRREGRRLSIEIENQGRLATTGVTAQVLLPALQSAGLARATARRMNGSDNLKQIMLAMHNYHDAFNRLPEPASRDDDGNPLLSWRVAILPFIGQADLYEQFHLDEPWDSEHNAKLIIRMPETYKNPGTTIRPGTTVYHAVVGEDLAFRPEGRTRFQSVTDGLSNTVAVVETDAAVAVPWTKPSDVEIDLQDPLRNMGNTRPEGTFIVAMLDGSVRLISKAVDPDAFRASLTRSGGEVARLPQYQPVRDQRVELVPQLEAVPQPE